MTVHTHDSLALLSHALDQAGDLLVHVRDDQLGHPTPCRDWDVSTLVAHLVGGVRTFTVAARGECPDWSTALEPVTGDRAATFRAAADDLLHAWHQAGDAATPQAIDWQTAELALHGWDLARATGQPTDRLDAAVAERALEFVRTNLSADNRGAAFGPPVDVPDDAPVQDRLAALAGRDPTPAAT
ncbi:MAG TPA: TIGR03086 family metal-binding protein [Segeticoccus sp.]|uniref:TIGR03086 family metal-binding protein n=1 Tax=Segeticoccus sp. TaxID=2706531 RepID=UPI002D810A4A|nr:TIGR03086 family metal-binding protein [Segeticoccus sp.]HET8599289.1 TIGR03086 family metal-binding protein [Segeticoccus sp.]